MSLLHRIGLDRAVSTTALARVCSSGAGVVTTLLIAHLLSPEEQGYYYTFSSLLALQVVFELGFSGVILQLAAHERAALTFTSACAISGDSVAHARLASVLQLALPWYRVAAVALLLTLLPAGVWFFSATDRSGTGRLLLPWCALVPMAALNLVCVPMLAFLDGCGFTAEVASVRLTQVVIGSILSWAGMLFGWPLYAPALMLAGSLLACAAALVPYRKLFLSLLRHDSASRGLNWRSEIWPFQWRLAVSWLCGYFIFQLFNPVLLAYHGPVEAGRMGMSLTITTALSTIALSWMSTKATAFGSLVAGRRFRELDRLFWTALRQSLSVLLAGAALVLCGLALMTRLYPEFSDRVLNPALFGLLLATTAANHVVFCEAVYLRAHKREAFLAPSLVNAVLVGGGTWWCGSQWGASAVVVNYFLTSGVVGLCVSTWLFFTLRRRWHSEQTTPEVATLAAGECA